MYFSAATLAALFLSSSVLAGPIWGPGHGGDDERKNNKGKDWNNNKDKGSYKEYAFSKFKNVYTVKAFPDQVVSGQGAAAVPAPGEPGAKGFFKFGINVHENTICYSIVLSGVTGEYQSPANTATHIHEAARGANGPPCLAFPNPVGPDDRRVSQGCLTGPFSTGIVQNGTDTGAAFHVRQIVENPSEFFADTHAAKYVPGAVRGQLA